jgi:hypothetical protein
MNGAEVSRDTAAATQRDMDSSWSRTPCCQGGNALLGLEPRYDFCRCEGFWSRTRHAVSRNFVAYNRSERELRPQIPAYTAAFAAGLLYNSWLPGQHNIWAGGAYNVLSLAGIGSGYNFVSEFALDILHAVGLKKDVRLAK